MTKKRPRRSAKFKAQLAIEALRRETPLTELSAQSGVDMRVITRWKNQLIDESEKLFVHKLTAERQAADPEHNELRRKAKQLELELEYLKKKLEL